MINPEEIKQQMLRIEGFSDGIKNGASIMAQWFLTRLAEIEKKEKQNSESKEN